MLIVISNLTSPIEEPAPRAGAPPALAELQRGAATDDNRETETSQPPNTNRTRAATRACAQFGEAALGAMAPHPNATAKTPSKARPRPQTERAHPAPLLDAETCGLGWPTWVSPRSCRSRSPLHLLIAPALAWQCLPSSMFAEQRNKTTRSPNLGSAGEHACQRAAAAVWPSDCPRPTPAWSVSPPLTALVTVPQVALGQCS